MARCEQSDGASWLNVTKATGPADHRPTVTEKGGPTYGYHVWDLGLAQDNLVSDVAAAEITWTHGGDGLAAGRGVMRGRRSRRGRC